MAPTAPPEPPPAPAAPRIVARVRFEDPTKFLEFYERQLGRGVIGLRHGEPVPEGTPIQVLVGPPGAPDRLSVEGRAARVSPRPDGTVRVRVEVDLDADARTWLDAYLAGLRAALSATAAPPPAELAGESTEVPPPAPAPRREAPPIATLEEATQLAARLDSLSYYELLGVSPRVEPAVLQRRFHTLTRRFHPDLFYGVSDPALRAAIHRIYRRMNEAYGVLRDPRRRRLYDRGLAMARGAPRLRLSEEDEQLAQRQARTRRGTTGAGHFYWTLAREVLERARQADRGIRPALRESARLLRTALVFEPENEHFQHALEYVSDRLAMPEDD